MIIKLTWPDGYECWLNGQRKNDWMDNSPDDDPRLRQLVEACAATGSMDGSMFLEAQLIARDLAPKMGATVTAIEYIQPPPPGSVA